jgi:hypothetical protein
MMSNPIDWAVAFWRFVGVIVVLFGLFIGTLAVLIVVGGGWFALAGVALMLWALALVLVGGAMVIDP